MNASAGTPGFVPVSDWPTLEELAVGYGEHRMEESNKLAGKSFEHAFDNGYRISHSFSDDKNLTWQIVDGGNQPDHTGLKGEAEYDAFEVRPNAFFIDFYKPAYEEQVSLVLDIITGQAVVGVSGFTGVAGERRTWTKFTNATMSGNTPVEAYQPTDELIGKHILYRYTPRDAYEHIYLNQGTLAWHCLAGTEKGLADAEECKMLKLGESLYLLFWTETIMPVESVVVVDLEKMRSTGRFFCWDPKPQRMVRMSFGSYATILAEANPAGILSQPAKPSRS